jgi:hypothetical protein
VDAAQELVRRRADSPPSTAGELEAFLATGTYAVLFRQVATPNFEFARFVSLASDCGLTPLILEFHRDKYVIRNAAKIAIARMSFQYEIGRNSGMGSKHLSVVDLSKVDGRRLNEVTTVWGDPFIGFHHELLERFPPQIPVLRFEGSDWFNSHGGKARDYYTDLLSLFVRHAVLFETFLLDGGAEGAFTIDIVLPAFADATARHGVPPLMCSLDPPEHEGCSSWYAYHTDLLPYVESRIVQRP